MTHYGFTDVRVIPVLGGLMAIHVARKPRQLPTPFKPRAVDFSGKRQGVLVGRWTLLALEPRLERLHEKP